MKCLVPDCAGVAVARGLCSACHSAANRQVRRQTTTWEALVRQGRARPVLNPHRARPGGRKSYFVND